MNVLGSNQWSEDVVPTVAFNLRQVRKGNVTMKVWDVAVSHLPHPKRSGAWQDREEAVGVRQEGGDGRRHRSCADDGHRASRSLGGCGIGIVEERMR